MSCRTDGSSYVGSEEVPPDILTGCLWLRCPVSVTHCVPGANGYGLRLVPGRVRCVGRGAKGALSVTPRPAAARGALLFVSLRPAGWTVRGGAECGRRSPLPAPGRPLRPFRAAPQPHPAPHADVGRQMKGFRSQVNVIGKESYHH